jgi:hypothetical protein
MEIVFSQNGVNEGFGKLQFFLPGCRSSSGSILLAVYHKPSLRSSGGFWQNGEEVYLSGEPH